MVREGLVVVLNGWVTGHFYSRFQYNEVYNCDCGPSCLAVVYYSTSYSRVLLLDDPTYSTTND